MNRRDRNQKCLTTYAPKKAQQTLEKEEDEAGSK